MLFAWYFIQNFLHAACTFQHGRFHLDFKEDHGFSGSWDALPILTTQVVKWLLFHGGVSCPFKISVAQLSHQRSWRPSWEAELSTATLCMFSPLPKLQYLGSYLFFPWELPGLQVNPPWDISWATLNHILLPSAVVTVCPPDQHIGSLILNVIEWRRGTYWVMTT